MHRGTHETIDEERPGFLIDFIFYRVTVRGNLDNDIDIVGYVLAAADAI